jgi:hypothetical protein
LALLGCSTTGEEAFFDLPDGKTQVTVVSFVSYGPFRNETRMVEIRAAGSEIATLKFSKVASKYARINVYSEGGMNLALRDAVTELAINAPNFVGSPVAIRGDLQPHAGYIGCIDWDKFGWAYREPSKCPWKPLKP